MQLAASVAGSGATPTGSVSYFVDGCVMSNTSSQTSVALANGQAAAASFTVPALPDGAYTHSYTVTAVYSGDSNYQPAVATQTVQLTGPSGDFAVSLNPPQFPVGTTVSVTTVLPVATVAGTLALNLIDSSQNVVASVAASSVSSATNVTPFDIPANVLSFTGIVTSGNNQISSVSSTSDLTPGQVLTGTGISPDTTIISFSPGTITMSGNATTEATGTSTTITSNAALVGFAIQAVYVPTVGSGTLTGQINFAFQA
ncbi:Ig-like domain repeat protein [Undibacterium sp. YM2]|uniref:Ig-like domain repeat protein n=1 Tax=Undibacterium sp. YM2 TaxID=2058625 RepID=UPI001E5AA27D|nr:Ig-like domain repeat protein [Undibacterium sp. YM2]